MKSNRYGMMMGVVAGLVALSVAGSAMAQANPADVATMAGVKAAVAQAANNLVAAATETPVDTAKVAEARKRLDAVDAAAAAAEQALAAGDSAALAAAAQRATDALNGTLPETPAVAGNNQNGNQGSNTGGAGNPPNIYDVPWQSQAMREFHQGQFKTFWEASTHGGGRGYGELGNDATKI